MMKFNSEKGQSLMEIVFAIAIFTVGIVAIGYLSIDAQRSLNKHILSSQARLLAVEGIEVARIIRDNDFASLTPGTHGLQLAGGLWSFVGSVEEVSPAFDRSIIISNVSPGIKKVSSKVTWSDSSQVGREVFFDSYLTDWRVIHEEAEFISIDTSSSTLSEGLDSVIDITIENTGPNPITIIEMVVEWNNLNTLSQIIVQGTEVFSSLIGINSGEVIDITDYVLGVGTGTHTINQIQFSDSMIGSNLTIKFNMSDNSQAVASTSF